MWLRMLHQLESFHLKATETLTQTGLSTNEVHVLIKQEDQQ